MANNGSRSIHIRCHQCNLWLFIEDILSKFMCWILVTNNFFLYVFIVHQFYSDYRIDRTERGYPRLRHRGYEYRIHLAKRDQPLKYWQCKNYQRVNMERCKSRAVLLFKKGLKITEAHNHEPEYNFLGWRNWIVFFYSIKIFIHVS